MHPALKQLRERKLVQWTVAYFAGAWVVLQVIQGLGEPWGLGASVLRITQVVLAVGYPIVAVLAWYHGEKGHQRVSGPELVMIACLLGIGGVGIRLVAVPGNSYSARRQASCS